MLNCIILCFDQYKKLPLVPIANKATVLNEKYYHYSHFELTAVCISGKSYNLILI